MSTRKRIHRKTLPRATWVKMFNRCDIGTPTGTRDRTMYYFMYFTGIRVGELLNLRVKDINLNTGKFRTPREGKTGQRTLSFPDSKTLHDLLERWLKVREQWGVQDSPYFFCTRSGEKIEEGNFSTTFRRRARKAGIDEKVSPHMLRHSYASERVHEGVDVLDLMTELGHRNIRTTMVYLHQENVRAVNNMRSRVVD